MMVPFRDSSRGTASREQRKGPTTLTASVASSFVLRAGPADRGPTRPALLTRQSSPPQRESTSAKSFAIWSRSVTSQRNVRCGSSEIRRSSLEQVAGPLSARHVLDDDRGAGLREQAAARGADAAAAARHQDPAAREIDQAAPPRRPSRCPGRRRCRPRRRPGRRRGGAAPSSSVIRRRVPEAPSGWPRAMAPPLTFSLSTSRPRSLDHGQDLARRTPR